MSTVRGVDVVSTLDPANGLVAGWQSFPPRPPAEPMWRVMVDLGDVAGSPPPDPDYPFSLVGAYGVGRADALVRGAGEAVERAALRPTAAEEESVPFRADREPALTRWITADPAGFTHPRTFDHAIRWYPGRSLGDGRPVLVPAPLVDWWGGSPARGRTDPAPFDPASFDPSPSGAAAGADPDHATRAALLEIIERDAVVSAWCARLAAVRVDVDAVMTAAAPSADRSALRTLLAAARAIGARPVFGRLPTAVDGVECVVCVITEHGPELVLGAVGAKASPDPVRNLLCALQESLQIRTLLTVLQRTFSRPSPPPTVTDDVDRAWLWTTPRAVDALDRWAERFVNRPGGPTAARERSLSDLVSAVRADGGEPVVVPLTARLPPAVAAAGWSAVKVICPGYQALRMDERRDSTWCPGRVADAAARTGLNAGPADDLPHPLI